MRKIPPTILIIVISLFLSGCNGGSSSNGDSAGFSSSGNSISNYYTSSDSSLSSSGLDSGGAVGHHNPEPASLALLGSGLLGLLGAKLRKRKR